EGGSTEGGSTEGGSTEGGSTEGGSTEENPSAHTHTLIHTEKTNATCSQEGNTEYWYCSDCKKYYSDESGTTEISLADTVIEKLEHTVVVDSAVAATCTSTGLTEGSHCSVCNTVIVAQEVTEKSEHTVVVDSAVAATCTSTGLTEGSHCSVCNTVIVAQEVTEKSEHTVVVDSAVAATCTSTGLTEGSHCSVCNTVIVAQEITEKVDHTYNGYSCDNNSHWQVCTVCEEQTEAEDHTYGSDNICTVCGMKKTSEGLKFTLSSDEKYYTVSSIGECTDTDIVIPSTYDGLPVEAIGGSAFNGCTTLTSVTISNSVTSINSWAFQNCTLLTSVTIPNSVTSIGDYAFKNCTSLTSVTIPDSVTSIGGGAFYNCTSLESVTIGNSVTSIDVETFRNCTSLESVTIPDSVTYIGYYAFRSCTSLKSVTIGNSVTSIGYYAFDGCTSLESVTIPNSVTSIGNCAFYNCTSLESVTIPNSVTSIGSYAFAYCESLTSVTIPDTVISINSNAFYYCKSLTSVTIPDSVTSIGDYAFSGCTLLTSVTIPNSVTSVGYSAFQSCTSLTSISIPNRITTIGTYAFRGCTSLTCVTIGNSVTSIDSDAFRGCTSLSSVYYNGTAEEWSKITISSNNTSLTSATRYYYSASEPDYTDGYNYWHYVNGVITIWVQGATDAAYVGNSYTIDYTTLTYYVDDVESEEAKEDFAGMLGSVANYTLTFTDSKDFTCVYYSYTRDTYYTATGSYLLDNESNIFIFSNCSWTDESDSDTLGDATTFLNDGWAVFGYDGTDVTVLVYIERNQPVYTASGIMQLVNNVSVVDNTYELTDIEYTFSDSVTEERQESIKTSYSQTIGMTMAFNSDGTASFTYPEAVDYMNTMVADMTITYVVNNDNTITITSVYDSDVSIITVKIIDSETLSQELDMLENSSYSM
ncbi:MAG: leucine-rich repeat domain-containing protein, partial [Clostridia bacterium]|nr:leucine-rich repeat domain-containing protein [Clostridia bacterium]